MMFIHDGFQVVLFLAFLCSTLRFFWLSWRTKESHPDDEIVQQHFMEHAIAAGVSFIGALFGTVWSFAHLVSIHQSMVIELPQSIALDFILISSTLFMAHMIKEQTPNHPYYIRENSEV